MNIQPLTIIVTSCDRFDLLVKTLDSFFILNKYPYVAFHIHNDSVKEIPDVLKHRYFDKNITWHTGIKRGLSASWDYLVSLVNTEYFFNIEDDWFFSGNENFIEESIFLLQYYNQVWIRDAKDHNHPLTSTYNALVSKSFTNREIIYNHVIPNGDWCGFTFNPSVRKASYWRVMFPEGISGKDEIELSIQLKGKYNAVSLTNSAIKHIGWNRHTQNFKI